MSAQWTHTFRLSLDALSRAAALVEVFGQQEAWEPELVFQMQLAIDEVGTNLMEHDMAAHAVSMEIALVSSACTVVLHIVDDGNPFNPLRDAPPPDISLSLADRPLGGLGLHLIQTLMDEESYRWEHGKNHLTLVKHRATRQAPSV